MLNQNWTERWAPVVTTKRKLRCAQPLRLGVRRVSPAAPRGARPASVALGTITVRWREEKCIQTNYYVAIYSVPRVLHVCYSVRDVSDAKSWGPSGPRSEVQSPEGFSIDSSIARIDMLHRDPCGYAIPTTMPSTILLQYASMCNGSQHFKAG